MRALNDMQITKVAYTACRAFMAEYEVRLTDFDRISDDEKAAWLWTARGVSEECVWLTGGDVHAIWSDRMRQMGWSWCDDKFNVKARMHPWLRLELEEVYERMFQLFGDIVLCGFRVSDKSLLSMPLPVPVIADR